MKTAITTLIIAFFTGAGFAQSIVYEKTFDAAIAKASEVHKPIFFMVDVPPNARSVKSALEQPDVVSKYNQSFVCYKVLLTDTAYIKLRPKYPANILPAYFFLDKYGSLLYRDVKQSIYSQKYLDMADSALTLANSGTTLTDYDFRYHSGNVDATFLKEYITQREKMNIFDNAKLIEEYVMQLPVNWDITYKDVLFILNAGPVINGNAFQIAHSNRKFTDSLYKTEPSALRSALNSHMRTNTYKEAVATKNEELAQKLSYFVRAIYRSGGPRVAGKESLYTMVSFFQAVKDTTNYLKEASIYYDNYYMDVSIDSARRSMERQRDYLVKSANTPKPGTIDTMRSRVLNPTTVKRDSYTAVVTSGDVASILNSAAYNFYTLGTRDNNYLARAISWSRRSLELRPGSASYYDTLGHLLYRYKLYTEAIENQSKAVELAGTANESYAKRLKNELEKMNKRSL